MNLTDPYVWPTILLVLAGAAAAWSRWTSSSWGRGR